MKRHGIEIVRSTCATLRVIHIVETPTDESALHVAVLSWHADSEGQWARKLEPHLTEDTR